jgi:hypothetical protein
LSLSMKFSSIFCMNLSTWSSRLSFIKKYVNFGRKSYLIRLKFATFYSLVLKRKPTVHYLHSRLKVVIPVQVYIVYNTQESYGEKILPGIWIKYKALKIDKLISNHTSVQSFQFVLKRYSQEIGVLKSSSHLKI